MAKGTVAKALVFKKILDTFGEQAFPYNDGKEIRINMEENGELCQIKVTLTAAKTAVEAGDDNALPTAAATPVSNEINFEENKDTIIEPTEEEKENVKKMLQRLGL